VAEERVAELEAALAEARRAVELFEAAPPASAAPVTTASSAIEPTEAQSVEPTAAPVQGAANPDALTQALERLTSSMNERLEKMGRKMGISSAVEADQSSLDGLFANLDEQRVESNFDAVEVKNRETFQNRILKHNIIVNQADRLRCIQVKVCIAKTADIEARECAAERAFDVEAGDASGKRTDICTCTCRDLQCFTAQSANGNRYLLKVFFTALRGDDDCADAALIFGIGVSVLSCSRSGGQECGRDRSACGS
jgi:hypothetical protein